MLKPGSRKVRVALTVSFEYFDNPYFHKVMLLGTLSINAINKNEEWVWCLEGFHPLLSISLALTTCFLNEKIFLTFCYYPKFRLFFSVSSPALSDGVLFCFFL